MNTTNSINWGHLSSTDLYVKTGHFDKKHDNIRDLIKDKGLNKINPIAVNSILAKNFIIGDITLVEGISKTPWLSKIENSRVKYFDLPPHKNNIFTNNIIANKLLSLLTHEAINYVEGKKTIGILLSGGMDSRIISGILKKLQDDRIFTGNIVAITWGINNSRDVIYAKKISQKFSWDFVHIPITPETLYDNINLHININININLHIHSYGVPKYRPV